MKVAAKAATRKFKVYCDNVIQVMKFGPAGFLRSLPPCRANEASSIRKNRPAGLLGLMSYSSREVIEPLNYLVDLVGVMLG